MSRPGRGMPDFTKNRNASFKSLGFLFKFLKPFTIAIVIAIICAFLSSIGSLIGPKKLEELTNIIGATLSGAPMDFDGITSIAIFLLCVYIIAAILNYLQGYIMAIVTQRVTKKLRTKISNKINKIPLSYFDKTQYGDVLSRVTNDVDSVGMAMINGVSTLVSSLTLFIGSLLMMFITNWIMALAAIGATFIGFMVMGLILKRSQKYFVLQQKSLGKVDGHIEEVYTGHTIVKAYNAEKFVKKEFDNINADLYKSAWKSQFLGGLMGPLMGFISNLGYVAVCVVGAVLVANGQMEFGVIVAFMIYIRLFTQPLSQLGEIMTVFQSLAAASDRVKTFLNEKEMDDETSKTTSLQNVKGEVKFENVTFGYNENKKVINGFTADIKAGQKVAIVGPTGAGKTTLVNLLMRFYDVDSGDIKIDGVSIKDMSREKVHELFAMVLQDTWLFEGTVKQNIRYNHEGITDEQIEKACETVGIDHFIRTLPQGYDTVLDERTQVSAGQKQLLTIARATVKNAPMLILDEATSSVDTRTEELIQKAMDNLTKKCTSFIIAHRLSTIKNADIIFVVKDGNIVEQGKHDELLKLNGFYAELYNSQFAQ